MRLIRLDQGHMRFENENARQGNKTHSLTSLFSLQSRFQSPRGRAYCANTPRRQQQRQQLLHLFHHCYYWCRPSFALSSAGAISLRQENAMHYGGAAHVQETVPTYAHDDIRRRNGPLLLFFALPSGRHAQKPKRKVVIGKGPTLPAQDLPDIIFQL